MKRNLSRMFRTGVAAAAALLCAMPFQAAAEDYPSRPITLIMPFGAGNAPTSEWFIRVIEEAVARGIILLNITQCGGGRVSMENSTKRDSACSGSACSAATT